MWNYAYQVPEKRKVRYIIHSDCKNEADDQYTVVHALMMDRFDVRGIIAGHFDGGGGERFPGHRTADASKEEIERLLALLGLTGKYLVLLGASQALADERTPIVSAGAQFIIEEAMRDDPRPLFIGMQGAITDLACAILLRPEICSRMTCIWIGGGDYPQGGPEFNLSQDIHAANIVFRSAMPLWQVPRGTYKQFAVSLAELQLKVRPCGEIGRYLFEQLEQFNREVPGSDAWPQGESWTLGDEGCICALLEEIQRTAGYRLLPAPRVDRKTMAYLPAQEEGIRPIRVYQQMDVRLDLEDLFAKLRLNFPARQPG
ncbi:MAG: nucleoside hydrolase [Provencibacterium sp.]|jgi:purine nucleosidase|nr:nucleoside hydrolase [Provencibacterium sp.]